MRQGLSLKSERKNPWFKPWLTFSAHTINCVCHSIRSMFRVLGMYNFGWQPNFQKWLQNFEVVTSKFNIESPLTSTTQPKLLKSMQTFQILIGVWILGRDCKKIKCPKQQWGVTSWISIYAKSRKGNNLVYLYSYKRKSPFSANATMHTVVIWGLEGWNIVFPLDFEGKIHWYGCFYPLFQWKAACCR